MHSTDGLMRQPRKAAEEHHQSQAHGVHVTCVCLGSAKSDGQRRGGLGGGNRLAMSLDLLPVPIVPHQPHQGKKKPALSDSATTSILGVPSPVFPNPGAVPFLVGSNRGPAQMRFEERQRFWPRIAVSHRVVTVAMLIHEGMVGPGVGIKLVDLAEPG